MADSACSRVGRCSAAVLAAVVLVTRVEAGVTMFTVKFPSAF
jgi:hypothetical protein